MAAINLSEKEQWFLVELLVREILGMPDESWQKLRIVLVVNSWKSESISSVAY
jgi:hypothetical protein